MAKFLFLLLLLAIPPIYGWVELTTTFGSLNPQPQTVAAAEAAGWVIIDNSTERFAGVRYIPDMDVPDMVLIFDSDGQVIGLQSGAPEVDFMSGDCTKNDFYVRDTIVGEQFCLATYYFKDPRVPRGSMNDVEEIHLQMGDSWMSPNNLIRVPKYYSELKAYHDQWVLHKYVEGMGHHVTFPDSTLEDKCLSATPFQALYALNDNNECVNSGFTATHFMSTTGDGWENTWTSGILQMVYVDIPQCTLAATNAGNLTTMHVFLGNSTSQCPSVTD